MFAQVNEGLARFIKASPTAFHAVDTIRKMLEDKGYQELQESCCWNVLPGGRYYVTRNGSSIIALDVGTNLDRFSFNIAASHSDSPAFKIKENAELEIKGKYIQLNTEGYGGMLCAPWLDRPLSAAGRVVLKEGNRYITKLVNIDRDLVLIPNVAIHMNRSVNEGMSYNKQIDMLPLFGCVSDKNSSLKDLVAAEIQSSPADIYGMELYLYNRMDATVWGAGQEFISAPRLDDLQCAYTTLLGFLNGNPKQEINVYACFDNEEVGSGTKQGAGSTFLYDVLKRCCNSLGKTEEQFLQAAASGFMLSCDNAHAVHPNHPEKTDAKNCVYMNEGIVIKFHAGQKYTSDAVSAAVFRGICEKAGVPFQYFANRSDAAGGSTLGNIAMAQISMNCVDIGLPQLAMHSPYETAGTKDSVWMVKAAECFFNSFIHSTDGIIELY